MSGHVAVFGNGSWGTAFSMILADVGSDVHIWGRRPEAVAEINERHTNERYLPGVALPEAISATNDPAAALDGARVVVLAVPSQTLRANLADWRPLLDDQQIFVSLMKGIELGTSKRMSEVIQEAGGVDPERVVVVSGPNLAKEIGRREPAASVVASPTTAVAEEVSRLCAARYFRPYTSTDVVGVELGGAVKNVVALAVGMAEGMGLGDNSKASIITRGLAETSRLGLRLGADPVTFSGLAGVGDLIATCMSPLSRNHSFGVRLGRGMTVEEATAETRETAEGVKSCRSILQLARTHGVEMPIVENVDAVVAGERRPDHVADLLMSRARKAEGS